MVTTIPQRSAVDHSGLKLRYDAVVIGGGPAGLATSHTLTEHGIDHVVLEGGRLAERWRSERWDSLRLLTPNWQTRLPGWSYNGDDPQGFMKMSEVVDYLVNYANSFDAPIVEGVAVRSVHPRVGRFILDTSAGEIMANAVVVASGAQPSIPSLARRLAPSIAQIHSSRYRNPNTLRPGGVLVVGASASGIQIADELKSADRQVVLSVGRHIRLPRTYRGRDIHWWLDLSGTLETTIGHVRDIERARRSPSLQLVGSPHRRTLDLNTLAAAGVELVGRTSHAHRWEVSFAGDLDSTAQHADRTLYRLLDLFDQVGTAAAFDDVLEEPYRPDPSNLPASRSRIDLEEQQISTVLWATGFRPRYPWLHVPVTDAGGAIEHDGGVTRWPGLYTMGLPFMRRRTSTFLDGFGADAHDIVQHLADYLGGLRREGGVPRPT